MRLLTAVLLAAPLLAQQPATDTGAFTGSIDLGNRWITGVAGDVATYKSVVNLGQGPKVLGLDLSFKSSARKFFDKVNLRASNWGGEPYSTAHLDAEREGTYRLSLDYRNIAYFNALPSFADPTVATGFLFSQNSYDARRRMFDGQLDLFPTKRIVPYLGYSRDWGNGKGITDFVSTSNEFAVGEVLRDKTDNYRGGVRVELNRFNLTLEQGGTTYKDDQNLQFGPGTNFGNRTTPFLGSKLTLSDLIQAYGVRGSSVYSKAILTARPFSRLNLYGQFLYTQPKTDVVYNQTETGTLISPISSTSLITGQLSVLNTTAKQPHTSGSFSAELQITKRLRLTESVMTDRYHVTSAVISGVDYLIPSGTNTVDPADIARLAVNYNRQEVNAYYDVFSGLTLRGGYRYVWGDAQVRAANLSQLGPQESRDLKANVGLAGMSVRVGQKIRGNFDFEASSSNLAYFRNSARDYQKARARISYQMMKSLALSGTFSYFNSENPVTGFNNYSFLSRGASLSALWTPGGGSRLSLMAEYDRQTLDSELQYLIPNRLTAALSSYQEKQNVGTGMVNLALPLVLPKLMKQEVKVSLGGSLLESAGSRPMHYFQPMSRISLPLPHKTQLSAEWRYYGMTDLAYLYQAFRTHQFTVGLHIGL